MNPFVSSSSVQRADSIPELPESLKFIHNYVNKYNGYMEFEGGKQKDWFLEQTLQIDSYYRGSAVAAFSDTLLSRGFDYIETIPTDSAANSKYEQETYSFAMEENGQTYKIYLVKWSSTNGLWYSFGYDLKIAIIEDGFEEKPTSNINSLRYEKAVPEEVAFIEDYSSIVSSLEDWNDDSLMTAWYMFHISKSAFSTKKEELPKSDPLQESDFELFKEALVDSGFTLVKKDTVELEGRDVYRNEAMMSEDGNIYRYFYEKETAKAKYRVESFIVTAMSSWSINLYADCGYAVQIYTYYKDK
ncbi:MAG: hypothetical protein MJY99_09375 [Fibrobacter sp.]|nr:hypothetical protein [Fibrobacter sp.]